MGDLQCRLFEDAAAPASVFTGDSMGKPALESDYGDDDGVVDNDDVNDDVDLVDVDALVFGGDSMGN